LNASVAAFARHENSATNGLQSWNIDINTPFGSRVVEGLVSLEVVHVLYRKYVSISKIDSFAFIDATVPRVIRIESIHAVAVNLLPVPQSAVTQFKVHIENVPASVATANFDVLIGGSTEDIIFTTRDSIAKTAQIILLAKASEEASIKHGMIVFGSPPAGCVTGCCVDMSCKTVCGQVKLACFSLQYFDDALPTVTFLSDLVGPTIGMDIIKVHITNFPVMSTATDATAFFGQEDEKIGTVVLLQQSSTGTELLIVTPEFVLANGEPTKNGSSETCPRNSTQGSHCHIRLHVPSRNSEAGLFDAIIRT